MQFQCVRCYSSYGSCYISISIPQPYFSIPVLCHCRKYYSLHHFSSGSLACLSLLSPTPPPSFFCFLCSSALRKVFYLHDCWLKMYALVINLAHWWWIWQGKNCVNATSKIDDKVHKSILVGWKLNFEGNVNKLRVNLGIYNDEIRLPLLLLGVTHQPNPLLDVLN